MSLSTVELVKLHSHPQHSYAGQGSTKLGIEIDTIIRTFDFHQKNCTVVMTSSDFANDVIRIGVFNGFAGALGKNCVVT